jgi:hypothetical protein
MSVVGPGGGGRKPGGDDTKRAGHSAGDRGGPRPPHGCRAAYAHFRDRYRAMARTLGYEGHIDWAEAMP